MSTTGCRIIQAMPSTAIDDEPHDHDRAEQAADTVRAVPLNREHPDQDHDGDRHHVRVEQWRRDLEPLDRAEHRDRRRDHAVAVEQRRAEDAHQDEHRPAAVRCRCAAAASAVSARMPPSPWLSARITIAMYLTEITSSSE